MRTWALAAALLANAVGAAFFGSAAVVLGGLDGSGPSLPHLALAAALLAVLLACVVGVARSASRPGTAVLVAAAVLPLATAAALSWWWGG